MYVGRPKESMPKCIMYPGSIMEADPMSEKMGEHGRELIMCIVDWSGSTDKWVTKILL
jgi:hypothetical protein